MKITICGSMHHKADMLAAASILEKLGYEVETPSLREGKVDYNSLPDDERGILKESLIKEHLDKINSSDAVLIINKDKNGVSNYIGGNTLMEMAFAYAQRIEIFLLNPVPEQGLKDEVLGMKPIALNGEVKKIGSYFKQLPKTFVSSKSPVKLRAVSRGMRRAGIYTQVIAHPTQSGGSEQPRSIEETYQGAQNRHKYLKKETSAEKPAYFATVEGGLFTAHTNHNFFSSTVTILEKMNETQKVGISVELEYPREMTDKVPSQYPDLGVLVQKEYGSKLKDPFPFFTHGKIDRLKLVENAVFNVAAQLKE